MSTFWGTYQGGGGGVFTLSNQNVYSSDTGAISSGSYNFVTGAGAFGSGSNSGNYNNVIGYNAGYNNSSGYNNSFIGYNAGDANYDGYNNTIIGTSADVGSGSLNNSTAIGSGAVVGVSNGFVLGNYDVMVGIRNSSPAFALDVGGEIRASGEICSNGGSYCMSSFSDVRLKKDILPFGSSTLEKILTLNPVTYKWNNTYLNDRKGVADATGTKIGFIAQEIDMVFPEVVVHPNTPGGFLGVDYSKLTAVLTQGIKELYISVQEIKNKLNGVLVWFNNGNLNIQKDVCVDDVCVTKEQFKQMLRNGGASVAPAPSPVPSSPVPVIPDTNTSTSSDNETLSTPEDTLTTPTPDIVTTPVPEIVPTPTPVPEPIVTAPASDTVTAPVPEVVPTPAPVSEPVPAPAE